MTNGIAVGGLGMAHKPHIQSLRELKDRARIIACQSPTEARPESFASAHPDLPGPGDLGANFKDRSVDGVILLTPPMTHRDLVLRCAAADKHVLLEKPLDVTTERARQSIDAMQRADRRFGVVLQHRFRAASRKLISIVGNGELGE